ncbi:MAG: type II secretion system F family protein [Betaproteobacteria bacterium]|nr:type II secretion system F family protein [Betaproteobacteria bacterium]
MTLQGSGSLGHAAHPWWHAVREHSAQSFRLALIRAGVRHPSRLAGLAGLRTLAILAGLSLVLGAGVGLMGAAGLGLTGGGGLGRAGATAVGLGGLILAVLPDVLARAAAASRSQNLATDLPDAIDLITLAMESGLGLEASLHRVAAEMGHRSRPLGVEFSALSLALRSGVSRGEALADMAWRCNARELEMLAALVVQADRLGTPIIDAARALAQGMREAREFQAEERAGQVAVQLVIPLVLCMLPALFVVLLGPALLQVADALKDL